MSYVRRIGLVGCLLATAIIGCSSSTSSVGTYGGVEPIPNETEDGGLITGNGEPSPMPMLAKIDPAGTMVQTPGEGVGVFTQYEPTSAADPGGHWYVWWTCDTDISNEACPFSIEINVESGALTSAMAEGFGAKRRSRARRRRGRGELRHHRDDDDDQHRARRALQHRPRRGHHRLGGAVRRVQRVVPVLRRGRER